MGSKATLRDEATIHLRSTISGCVDLPPVVQYFFNAQHIEIIGDMPTMLQRIVLEMWMTPHYSRHLKITNQALLLVAHQMPLPLTANSGVTQSITGRLWRPTVMLADYSPWKLQAYDVVRIDHFRLRVLLGLIYDTTAINGEWVKGPGRPPLRAIRKELGRREDYCWRSRLHVDSGSNWYADETGFPWHGVQLAVILVFKDSRLIYRHHTIILYVMGTHGNETGLGWFRRLSWWGITWIFQCLHETCGENENSFIPSTADCRCCQQDGNLHHARLVGT